MNDKSLKTAKTTSPAIIALSIVLQVLLSACYVPQSEKPQVQNRGFIGPTEVLSLNSPELNFSENSLQGNGRATVLIPLNSTRSQQSYAVSFSVEDSGRFALVINSNEELQSGIELHFRRQESEFDVQLKLAEQTTNLSSLFSNLNASEPVNLIVDVHNNESPLHMIAWTGEVTEPTANNSVYDSIRDKKSKGALQGNGRGSFWGFIFDKSKITQAVVAEPKVLHQH